VKVLQPLSDSEDWCGFCQALYWMLGSDVPGRCDHTTRLAEALLKLRGYDAGACLKLYQITGGFCDCEILLNTDAFAKTTREAVGG